MSAVYICLKLAYGLILKTERWASMITLTVGFIGSACWILWNLFHHRENSLWKKRGVPFLLVAAFQILFLYYVQFYNMQPGLLPKGFLDFTELACLFVFVISSSAGIVNYIALPDLYSKRLLGINEALLFLATILLRVAGYAFPAGFILHAIVVLALLFLPFRKEQTIGTYRLFDQSK